MDKKFEITGNSHDCFDNQIFAEFVTTKQRFSEIDGLKISVMCNLDRIDAEATYQTQRVALEFSPKEFVSEDSGIAEGFQKLRSEIDAMLLLAKMGSGSSSRTLRNRRSM